MNVNSKIYRPNRRTRRHACILLGFLIVLLGMGGVQNTVSAHMGHMGGKMTQQFESNQSSCINPFWEFERNMSKRKKIRQARKGGPHISKEATVMARNRCGELEIIHYGSNNFICIPNADPVPVRNPVCLDPIGFEWYKAAYFGANPKPAGPGVGYMALGGGHWEIDGQVFPPFPKPDGAELVRDPPHWMLLWEFDSEKTGLPAYPNTGDITIVFDGNQFAVMLLPWDSLCSSERSWVGCLDTLKDRGLPVPDDADL